MVLVLIALLASAGMLIPLYVTADVHHGARRVMRLTVSIAGWRQEWVAEAVRGPDGRKLLIGRKGRQPHTVSPADLTGSPAGSMTTLLRESHSARRFLMRHTHAEQIDAQLLLHTASAASTALLTGTIHTGAQLLPARWRSRLRLRVLPDFLRDHSTLQARCIFRVCVGTIIITAGLLLATLAAQAIDKEAHSIWNTPSEN